MTLVELMVSLAVTALVMASVVGIFASQHRNYVRDRSEKEAFLDTLDVVRVLERDLREAGWSVPANMALFIKDGDDNGSDRVYINDVDLIDPMLHASRLVESSCPGCLAFNDNGTLLSLSDPWDTLRDPMDINGDGKKDFDNSSSSHQFVITDARDPEKKVALITAVSGTKLTVENAVEGTLLAPAIYYCVDNGTDNSSCHPDNASETRVLRRSDRNTQGLVPVADNVVDLQVAYLAVNDNGTTLWYGESGCSDSGTGANKCTRDPFEPERIRLIRLTVVLRSPTKDKDRLNDPRYCRPAVENRQAGTGPDECGYQYKVHTIHIHPRNT